MSIGYGIEVALGFGLAAAILTVQFLETQASLKAQPPRRRYLEKVLHNTLDAFFDCAIYFALAVELASVVMLARKDFGVNTKGFGACDAQITLANSVVCVLPLLYPLALGLSSQSSPPPDPLSPSSPSGGLSVQAAIGNLPPADLNPGPGTHAQGSRGGQQLDVTQKLQGKAPESKEELRQRQDFRLLLFSILALLFFYPFISQCIRNWGPSRIATLPPSVEWSKVIQLCFGDVQQFSDAETLLVSTVELLASLTIYGFLLWQIIVPNIQPTSTADFGRVKGWLMGYWKDCKPVTGMLLLLTPLALSIPLLWSIFRLRDIQSKVMDSMRSQYTGNEWGFGQIIGVVIFAPVATEAGFTSWKYRSWRRRRGGHVQDR